MLLKYHYVFDVGFDSDLCHFYAFFEYLMGVPGATLCPKMTEFLMKVRNLSG